MRVIIVAEDNYAGVHANLKPLHMPAELRSQAEKDMAFFGLQGQRPTPAHVPPIFTSDVSAEHARHSTEIFSASMKEVQQRVGGGSSGSPHTFEPTKRVLSRLREVAEELGPLVQIGSGPLNVHKPSSRDRLLRLLERDGSVMVDERGNVIMGSRGAETVSQARTSALELIRGYTYVHRQMQDRFNIALPHQGYCSIVKRRASGEPAKGLMELGATGSFLELKRPTSNLPAMGYIDSTNLAKAREFAASLPQLYQDIGITVGQITEYNKTGSVL
jgi:hypothetical protein